MRALRLFVVMVTASGCAITSFAGYLLAPGAPDDLAHQHRRVTGLVEPVRVTFDPQGVPHVDASSVLDLARAVGFVQGRARFFQLDLLRRLARGRLAELVGEQPLPGGTTLDSDKTLRGWNLETHAEDALGRSSPEQRAVLEAFCAGVNAAREAYRPLEYRLLRLEPEPWRPADTLAIGLLTVWSGAHNAQQELARLSFAMSRGVDAMESLYPSDPSRGARSIAATGVEELPPSVVAELKELFPVVARSTTGATISLLEGPSNAWAISGTRTRSGKPMVATDAHLAHVLPGALLQVHLVAPGLDVIGVTVPGLPWVLAGHNTKVAWGVTSTTSDVIDLVIERPSARAGLVEDEGGECPVSSRIETIRVRDGDELLERQMTYRATCHGPLANDLYPQLLGPGAPWVSIRWNVEGVEGALAGLLRLNRVSSVEEFKQVVQQLPATWTTWTVADVDGHLGQFVSGRVPLRPNHRGTFPVPGWLERYTWQGFASASQLPQIIDPPSGVLVHANNLITEPTSTEFARVHVDSAPGYRHQRITSLLDQTPKHDVESFRAMLVDTVSLRAEQVMPAFRHALSDGSGLSAQANSAWLALQRWRHDATADSAEAAIFFLTWRLAITTALADEVPAPVANFFLAQRYSTNAADLWFEQPDHPVWDDRTTEVVERRDDVLRLAFERAVRELVAAQGPDINRWRWGALHWHQPKHPFGSKAVLEGTVNLARHEVGGELDTIWKSHFDLSNDADPFKVVAGPVSRSVVDLADLAHGWWVVDSGASGWPRTPHYGDQYEVWRRGDLVPMLFDIAEVRRGVHGSLELDP